MRVCKECGTVAEPRSDTPGSILIELVLWLCFIVPGLIYSFWRISKRRQVCPACESPNIVPLDTPVGRALAGHCMRRRYIEVHRVPKNSDAA